MNAVMKLVKKKTDPKSFSKIKGISFIIPCLKRELAEECLRHLKQNLKNTEIEWEIFLALGRHPTAQRNRCIEKARYDYIYFLDNDSLLFSKTLRHLQETFLIEKNIDVLGGPSLLASGEKSFWQHTVDAVFSSRLAVGKLYKRYRSLGKFGKCRGDTSLILCNMLVKKSLFKECGLFNENLYPNEENEFLNRLFKQKKDIFHHPKMWVFRKHRNNLKALWRQLFSYGRGRAEAAKISQKKFYFRLILPVMFLGFFLGSMALLLSSFHLQISSISKNLLKGVAFLWTIYLLTMMVSFLLASWSKKRVLFYYPIVFFSCHFFYGLGVIKGLLSRNFLAKHLPVSVKIIHLKNFK